MLTRYSASTRGWMKPSVTRSLARLSTCARAQRVLRAMRMLPRRSSSRLTRPGARSARSCWMAARHVGSEPEQCSAWPLVSNMDASEKAARAASGRANLLSSTVSTSALAETKGPRTRVRRKVVIQALIWSRHWVSSCTRGRRPSVGRREAMRGWCQLSSVSAASKGWGMASRLAAEASLDPISISLARICAMSRCRFRVMVGSSWDTFSDWRPDLDPVRAAASAMRSTSLAMRETVWRCLALVFSTSRRSDEAPSTARHERWLAALCSTARASPAERAPATAASPSDGAPAEAPAAARQWRRGASSSHSASSSRPTSPPVAPVASASSCEARNTRRGTPRAASGSMGP
mmetsp:Transcript_24946/g.94340  ORF Transcript_24946/g.94340 Transcript_24946/m.94340 type:complete len:349 (-) Transcript_24946:901-1947(-)